MTESGTDSVQKPMSKTFVRIWLAALIVVALFVRVQGMDAYYYSPDEAMHVDMAQGQSTAQVWQFSLYETHPPLGNFLRHYWMSISDAMEFVRGQSLLFGIGLLFVYYAIGRRLSGELCGMCCASMVAFSQGCIIQSTTARNYAFFLFFISLGFYFSLLWREKRSVRSLLGYCFCGCLACTTHFSGVFCISCIALCEMPGALRTHTHLRWIVANALVISLALAFIIFWQPTLTLMQLQYFNLSSLALHTRIFAMLLYPLSSALYLFPSHNLAMPLICFFTAMALWPGGAARSNRTLQFLLALMGCAFALGMVLFIFNIYTSITGKHIIWTFPFIIPALGWLLSDACARAAQHLARLRQAQWAAYLATGIFIGSWALYSPADRFADTSEYAMNHSQYDALKRFYATLGPGDLIVMHRDDAAMFANIYPALGNDAFTGLVNATVVPYLNTRILFNPFFRRLNETGVLLNTLLEAKTNHMLDGVDRLIFFYSLWPQSAVGQLILCPSLDKEMLTFPPKEPGHRFSREELSHEAALVLIVQKAVFFKEVLSPAGNAHSCLDKQRE